MPEPPCILVAEDEPFDALLLRLAFARAGLRAPIHFVSDGQQVIDYLLTRPPFDDRARFPFPSLLVLDLKLPRRDGFEVLEWWRTQPNHNQITVVLLSAVDDSETIHRAWTLGADHYIVKPRDARELVRIAERLKNLPRHSAPDAFVPA